MKKLASIFVPVFVCGLWPGSVAAQDRLFVDVNQGTVAPLSVGVPEIASGLLLDEAGVGDVGQSLARIMGADLSTSAFFRVVPTVGLSTDDNNALLSASAADGVQGLVIGRPTRLADGRLRYACSYYDVFSEALEISRDIEVPAHQWRRAAHKCADLVFTHTTGYPGHFDSRFVMTADVAGGAGLRTNVMAVDFDGAHMVQLAPGQDLVAMPRMSPDGRFVVFMAYARDVPRLIVANIDTGARTTLQLPTGLPSAARFSPDGGSIVFALARNGDSDIFEYELATGKTVQLTDTTGTDTSPAYAPDGLTIAFESDRSGEQQVYLMRRNGSDQRRITFGDAHGSPVWNPRGDALAFVRFAADGSRIAASSPDGSGTRLISAGPHDEDPSWAPSGRAVSFQRTAPGAVQASLWIADISGTRAFAVAVGSPVSEPQWSEYAE
jgi:TolB protein